MPPENPISRRSQFSRLLWGQMLVLGAVGLIFILHSGADFEELGSPVDAPYLVIAASWLVSLALVLWRAPARPQQTLYLSLAPAVLGLGAACLYIGQVPRMPQPAAGCDLLVVSAFLAERHLALGLLATGSLWVGSLPLLSPGPGAGVREAWWAFLLAGVMFAVAAVWTFVDPALPARDRVGGYAVRGLWVLLGGGAVLWLWARLFLRVPRAPGAPAAILAATFGLCMLAFALVSYHRACGLHRMAFGPPAAVGGFREQAGLVAATALARLLPALLLTALATVVLALARSAGPERRRTLVLSLALLALGGAGAGYELGWRDQYGERCAVALPEDFELPSGRSPEIPAEGSLLVLSERSAWLDGDLVLEGEIPTLGVRAVAPRESPLNLAADSNVEFQRLYTFLSAAGVAGWNRFRLLVRRPDPPRCAGERRLYGVCLSDHPSYLGAVPFERPHFQGGVNSSQGVVANLIVESDRMEVSFGGFGASSEELDSLAATLLDRLGVRDFLGLEKALGRARERFSSSRTLILLPHDEMIVSELVSLLEQLWKKGRSSAFPNVVLSRLLR